MHELANFDVSRAVARQRAVTGTEIGSKTSCRELRPLSQGRAGVSKMHSPTRIVGAAVETWRAPVTHSHDESRRQLPRDATRDPLQRSGSKPAFSTPLLDPAKGCGALDTMFSSRFPSRWPRGSSARPRGSQTKAIAFDISAMSGVIAAVTIGTARSKLLNTVLSGSDDTALVARDLFFSQVLQQFAIRGPVR